MRKDLKVGMRHGHLTITASVSRDRFGIARFRCKCDCGLTTVLRSNHFTESRTFCSRKCKLLSKRRVRDLSGKRFSHWLVIAYAGIQKRTGWALWRCECKCGKRQRIAGAALTGGLSRSCGCLLRDKRRAGRTKAELAEARKASHKAWRDRNGAKIKAVDLRHKMKLRKATPSWLTDAHWAQMNRFYERAKLKTKRTGIRHDVDHIIPIAGETVSGLHVPWNLQILTQRQNVRKSNRYAELSGD